MNSKNPDDNISFVSEHGPDFLENQVVSHAAEIQMNPF